VRARARARGRARTRGEDTDTSAPTAQQPYSNRRSSEKNQEGHPHPHSNSNAHTQTPYATEQDGLNSQGTCRHIRRPVEESGAEPRHKVPHPAGMETGLGRRPSNTPPPCFQQTRGTSRACAQSREASNNCRVQATCRGQRILAHTMLHPRPHTMSTRTGRMHMPSQRKHKPDQEMRHVRPGGTGNSLPLLQGLWRGQQTHVYNLCWVHGTPDATTT
jgi:hypothetical protein